MQLVDLKSLVCGQGHCFDLARQGYLNLLSHTPKTKYNKRLFKARRTVGESGFFEPLHEKVSVIINQGASNGEPIRLLDAGCGEGSHLAGIREKISLRTPNVGIGVDIAKEGIHIASRENANNIWCVGDLANSPFASQSFNWILNILSPANYSEFQRMMTDDGRVIKVIPGRDYLQELRKVFFRNTSRQAYLNGNTIDRFQDKFKLLDMENVQYGITLDRTMIDPLIRMTPLSWGTTEERLQKIFGMGLREITVDLVILVGSRK